MNDAEDVHDFPKPKASMVKSEAKTEAEDFGLD
jgi:hypothetical protein